MDGIEYDPEMGQYVAQTATLTDTRAASLRLRRNDCQSRRAGHTGHSVARATAARQVSTFQELR